ncbi:hypothetical protein Pcinc_009139, partial [Petrolisthes cinctipes]
TSLNNLTVNSRATTARASNIDKDWQRLLTNNKTPPLNTVTQVHSPDTQSTPTQTLTPNLQAPALNTGSQAHSPHTCSTSTQPLTSNILSPSINSSNNLKKNTNTNTQITKSITTENSSKTKKTGNHIESTVTTVTETANTCRWITWCDFCNREGHSVQNCRSLRAQKQNQTLSQQLTVLVDTLSRHLIQPTSLINPPALLSNPLTTQLTDRSHAGRQ